MPRKQYPSFIMKLTNGFCKKNCKTSIPVSLQKLILLHLIINNKYNLFGIRFIHQAASFEALSSITSIVMLNNALYKLTLSIGKDLIIQIHLLDSKIEIIGNSNSFKIKNQNDKMWKARENIQLIIRVNRKTQCSCFDTKGDVHLYFRNGISKHYINPDDWHKNIDKYQQDGFVQISLKDTFDFQSNQLVTIETQGIDDIFIFSTKNGKIPCDKFGHGRQCCYWGSYLFNMKQT